MKRDNHLIKRDDAISEQTFKCKCGHSVFLPAYDPVKICTHCCYYVFRNEKEKFKFMLSNRIVAVGRG